MRNFLKKGMAALLSAVMVVTGAPQFAEETQAAENQQPTKEQFATAEELKSFNTNDNDGAKNPAKVYFGNNNQQWWIAGSQNGNVTLFAASPLATNQVFEPNYKQNKQYSTDWKCDYTSTGGSNPTDVYPNHYGASPLRTTLKGLETSYFTGAEQGLMNETTIYTNDTKNNSVYSTIDKLYLAYGNYYDGQYITVGTNSQNSLNNGLRIDKDYWRNSGDCWLRAPHLGNSNSGVALFARPSQSVLSHSAYMGHALVPAFELNLSSVIFVSAAPAASSSGDLTLQDTDGDGAFTLRHKTDTLGSALVSYDKSKVTLTNVPNDTYLVVQNSSEAKAKQITSETEVSATDMGLDSFANCKVWLETTNSNERMTYATLATEKISNTYDVSISTNTGLNITSNNGVQEVAPKTAITDITVEVANGYYLPDDYISNLQGQLNGLTVTETDKGFTISGTPTSDVNITLPAVGKEYFTVEGGTRNQDWTYSNGVLTIQKPGDYKISADGSENNNRIVVAEGFKKGTITIENINLKVGYNISPFEVNNTVDLTIILSGNNKLYSEAMRAGIEFNDSTTGHLTIDGTGYLEVQASTGGAAIGGAAFKSGNNITIKKGNIIASALREINHPGGSGIGGGYQGSAHNLVIDGGNIKATSGYYNAAIGVGADNADGDITINGGTIIAETSMGGAAIGSGYNCQNPIKVTINGGNITANAKGGYGVDIGSGSAQESEIFINGGTITCEKEGIGYNDNVVISGGSIKAPAISLDNKPAHNSKGEQLYPIKSMNESGLDEISIDGIPFKKDGSHISNNVEDSAFYLYLTGEDHKVTIGDKEFVAVWDNDSKQFIQKDYPLSPQDIQIERVYKDRIVIKSIEESVYGKAEYSLDEKNYQESNMFTGLEADTEYTVYVRYKGNNSYVPSKPVSVTTKTLKDGNGIVKEPSVKPTVYHDGLKLSDVKLPNGWKWENEETSLFAGTKNHSVLFDTTNYEAEYDFTGVDGYSADNHVIQRTVEVEIQKADTTLTFDEENIGKTYDKNPISEPSVTKTGSSNDVVFTWYIADKNDWKKLDTAPSEVGRYKVVASVEEDSNYKGASIEKEFEITSADSDITITPDKDVYVYEDQMTLDVSVDLAKKQSFFDRLFAKDNTVTAYVGDTAISSPVELDKNNHAQLTIDTKDENVRKVLKPSDQEQTITVKYNGSENLNNTTGDIAVVLQKKATKVSFKDSAFDLSRVYNGESVTVDADKDIQKTEDAPEVILKWNTEEGTALDAAPSKAGKYQLVVSIPEDEYYKGASVSHNFEIFKAELSVDVKVKDKQYDGLNTAEIEAASLVGVVKGDQITLHNGIPTFDSVEVGENIAIHFTEFTLEADEEVLRNYTLLQPTGVTANITNTWTPQENKEYTTSQPNEKGWLKEEFRIQAKEDYLLALGNKADGSRSTNWKKELVGSDEGANSIEFYVKDEKTGAISTKITEDYQLDRIEPKIQDLQNEKVYCENVTFTVKEKNLDVVKANEEKLTPDENGVYTLTAGSYQITAADQAGNETALAVTVNAEHTPDAEDGDCTTPIYCTVCDKVVKEAQEHSFTIYTSDSNATCLTDGTKTAICDHEGCEKKDRVDDKGSALGHDWGEWEIVTSPDCENKGSEKRTCKRCSFTETKELVANGHDWEEDFTVDQEATCTQEGSKSIHCKNCEAVKESTVIPATGHAYGEAEWSWSEDGKAATATFTCQNDSSHVVTENAKVTSAVKEHATCTQEGTTTYTAAVSFEENVYTATKDVTDIAALGHDWEEEYTIDKEASCTEEGSKSIHCKNCAETKNSAAIPATGHVYGEPQWNWNEDGKAATAAFTCQNDSNHVVTENAKVTNAVKEPATCTQEGTVTYTASINFEGNVYTDTKDSKEIPAAGHKYVHGVCTVCGEKDPNYQAHEAEGGSGNSSWNKGDENGLSVQIPGEIGEVTDVILNGKPLVEGTDYVVNDGTVILKPDVLEELKEGNYTLTIYGEKGYVETQIKIEESITLAPQKPENPENKKPNQGAGVPETGDPAELGLWFAFLFLSMGSIFSTYFYRKKKSN